MLVIGKHHYLFQELRYSLFTVTIQTLDSNHSSPIRVRHFSFINFTESTNSNTVLLVEVVGGCCYLFQLDFKMLKLLQEFLQVCLLHFCGSNNNYLSQNKAGSSRCEKNQDKRCVYDIRESKDGYE
ncbi:hypothetical protein Hanom_Chr04g00316851 [Helianthus anomalus]